MDLEQKRQQLLETEALVARMERLFFRQRRIAQEMKRLGHDEVARSAVLLLNAWRSATSYTLPGAIGFAASSQSTRTRRRV